ncbi:hypothetical protein [Paenibacillus sp. 481]|uniref:hypothetical protein n=1 Tax=Paenibacillus sp. 481 TaxID=2835869 RepID=UPI001E5215A9|nr:hypothetical protein [Paenibacillus sp. 481]UHA75040.1 hypothetical protein KIK04_08470 [Paenibacillus sp. 481]
MGSMEFIAFMMSRSIPWYGQTMLQLGWILLLSALFTTTIIAGTCMYLKQKSKMVAYITMTSLFGLLLIAGISFTTIFGEYQTFFSIMNTGIFLLRQVLTLVSYFIALLIVLFCIKLASGWVQLNTMERNLSAVAAVSYVALLAWLEYWDMFRSV